MTVRSRHLLLAVLILASSPLLARGADSWVGRKVFWKPGAKAKIGTTAVNVEAIPFGETVGAVEGDWLWVKRAWILKRDVHSTEQALDFYNDEIVRAPSDPAAYVRRAAVWKCKGEYDRAIADCDAALQLDRNDAAAYANRGATLELKGEHEAAIEDCTAAIRLDRGFALAYLNRGAAWGNSGQFQHAVNDLNEAIRLDPADALAYRNRGAAWRHLGNYEKALQDCSQAMNLDYTCADAFNDSAWLRATCPDGRFRDGQKALENAQKACELSGWKCSKYLSTLAAAYAELGQFDMAGEWEAKAVLLAKTPLDEREEKMQLEYYAAGKAYRDTNLRPQPASRGKMLR
jgi:tetratricopeptide (TPR) repeat protein